MRKVGLNTAAAKDALGILTKGELLEQVSEPTVGVFEFKTTEKGKTALAQYYQLITSFFGTKNKSQVKQHMLILLFAIYSCFVYGQIVFQQLYSFLAKGYSNHTPI